MKHFFTLVLVLLIMENLAFAQHKLAEIPLIQLSDFEAAPPEDAKMPIYINSRVYYRIDTVIQMGKHYKVEVKTKVDMQKNESFWDKSKVKTESEDRLLNHEQGHFYLAHVAANRIETEIAKMKFGEDWKEGVRNRFRELNQQLYKEFLKYDQETQHGRDQKAQEKWDKWIRKQLE